MIIVASVSCIYGIGSAESYHGLLDRDRQGRGAPARRAAAAARRHPVRAQRHRLPPRHLPRARRRGRDLPGLRGSTGDPRRVLRRRGRGDQRGRSAARRGARPARPLRGLPGLALRHAAPAAEPRDRRRSATSSASGSTSTTSEGRFLEKQRLEQRTIVRPRDARADGLRAGHRELLAPPLGPQRRASRRRR